MTDFSSPKNKIKLMKLDGIMFTILVNQLKMQLANDMLIATAAPMTDGG